jgi:hypothetical protein
VSLRPAWGQIEDPISKTRNKQTNKQKKPKEDTPCPPNFFKQGPGYKMGKTFKN